jgi:hypothetical protein
MCEWQTFHDWLADDIPLLHQILIEVHKAPKEYVVDFFDSLEADGYMRFHKEPNIQVSSMLCDVSKDLSLSKLITKSIF